MGCYSNHLVVMRLGVCFKEEGRTRACGVAGKIEVWRCWQSPGGGLLQMQADEKVGQWEGFLKEIGVVEHESIVRFMSMLYGTRDERPCRGSTCGASVTEPPACACLFGSLWHTVQRRFFCNCTLMRRNFSASWNAMDSRFARESYEEKT